MIEEKEKLIIENLISSKDVFARCFNLIKSSYFSPEYRQVITFLYTYFEKYHAIPHARTIKAETGIELTTCDIKKHEYDYTCDEIEKFCQVSGLKQAILQSSTKVNSPDVNMGEILELFKTVVTISLPKDLGVNLYESPEERLKEYIDTQVYISTGIAGLDVGLNGGCARKQLTLFSANSGVGKSIMLANIGANYSRQGYRVLYLSLELSEPMVFLRLASIVTGVAAREWKEKIPEISHKIDNIRESGAGDYIIKRIKNGSNANDIRSYLKTYELEYGQPPDVLIVDYLDIMSPNEGTKNLSLSEQDKMKAEQLSELLHEFDCIGLTASQQNREALNKSTPDQSGIAGGLTKVNAVDNYISIMMTPEMRLQGQMLAFFLKTRSSDGVGTSVQLNFNPINLIICDNISGKIIPVPELVVDNQKRRASNKKKSRADEILSKIKNENDTTIEIKTPIVTPDYVKAESMAINDNSTIEEHMQDILMEKQLNNQIKSSSPLDDLLDGLT